jgi:hypothetical protein
MAIPFTHPAHFYYTYHGAYICAQAALAAVEEGEEGQQTPNDKMGKRKVTTRAGAESGAVLKVGVMVVFLFVQLFTLVYSLACAH